MTNPKKDKCTINGHYEVGFAYALTYMALYVLDIHWQVYLILFPSSNHFPYRFVATMNLVQDFIGILNGAHVDDYLTNLLNNEKCMKKKGYTF